MSDYSVETVSSFQYPVIKQSKISDWQERRRDLLSRVKSRWKCLVMFEKGYSNSRTTASESVFIGKQISVKNEEVNVPALFKSVQKLAGKPSHNHGYQLLVRTVLEQWHSLVGATMATRRYPSFPILRRRKAAFRACSQANRARSPPANKWARNLRLAISNTS